MVETYNQAYYALRSAEIFWIVLEITLHMRENFISPSFLQRYNAIFLCKLGRGGRKINMDRTRCRMISEIIMISVCGSVAAAVSSDEPGTIILCQLAKPADEV